MYHTLSNANTMALVCRATRVSTIKNTDDIDKLDDDLPFFVLSMGSNVLLPPVLDAHVIRPAIMGVDIIEQNAHDITLKVGCGELWHHLVVSCTQNGWYGLENLALIPSLAGAAPIQNIGAYGVEIKDYLLGVDAIDLTNKKARYIDCADCDFGYRHSRFKTQKNHLITAIYLKLHKDVDKVCTSYGDLHAHTHAIAQGEKVTPMHVLQAVIGIRQDKLPDPNVLANCGSFFKNPIISQDQFNALANHHPTLPHYKQGSQVKIPAGWLIEQAGLKGKGIPPITTHHKQALVLVNQAPKKARQQDVLATQQLICEQVFAKFGVVLAREPVWVQADGSF